MRFATLLFVDTTPPTDKEPARVTISDGKTPVIVATALTLEEALQLATTAAAAHFAPLAAITEPAPTTEATL